MRDMSQGRAPEWANSTIFCRVASGNGRPPTNTPPNWLTPLWPGQKRIGPSAIEYYFQIKANEKMIDKNKISHTEQKKSGKKEEKEQINIENM